MTTKQSDSLSLATNVPLSGAGSYTPESAAGNADYTGWQWETILATVLGIPIPDRGALSGQPWLVVEHGGSTLPGAHQIWTASWDTKPTSGSGAISVYLDPSLYTVGGPWDQFQEAPAAALSGVPEGNYETLPMRPSSFQAIGLALASATNWFGATAQEFSDLALGTSSSGSDLAGSAQQVIADLFGRLGTITLSLHDQMSSPVAYSAAIEQAGEAATQFLANLWSAYSGWAQQSAHSPLGALVQLLTAIAEPGADGAYVIADPQDTPYGDLTTDQAWTTVEQQAKNLWLSLLTGETDGFAGLDPLGHAALSGLVSQYDSAISTLVPVAGPATPTIPPKQVGPGGAGGGGNNPPGNAGGGGNNHPGGAGGPGLTQSDMVTSGGGGGGGGGAGPGDVPPAVIVGMANNSLLYGAGGPAGGGSSAGGPPGGGVTGLSGTDTATGSGGSADAGTAAPPVAFTESLVAGAPPPVGTPPVGTPPAGTPGAGTEAADLSTTANTSGGPAALSGAIGAVADDTTQSQSALSAIAESTAFTGTIGKTNEKADGRTKSDDPAAHRKRKRAAASLMAPRQAPDAGSSLGRSPDGSVLEQSTVPTLTSGPPPVRSGPVNTQLVPSSSANGAAPPGAPAGAPASSASAARPAASLPTGNPSPDGQSMANAVANPGGEATTGTANGPMMMPPRMPGGGLGGQDAERQRLAYLPEDEEYWGTGPALPYNSIGSPHGPHPHLPDPIEAEEAIRTIGVIGGQHQADDR
jgi:hypothetical protein